MPQVEIPAGTDLSKIPVAPNPSGAAPNFVNPPSLVPAIRGIIIAMVIISVGFLGMRLLANLKQFRRPLVDDYFCFFGWACAVVYGCLFTTYDEIARHAWDVPLSAFDEKWLKMNSAQCMLVGPALWGAKIAIFILYMRLFGTVKWMRYTCWLCIITSTPIYLGQIPVCAALTIPYGNQRWDWSLVVKGTKMKSVSIVCGVYNIVSDIVLLILPLPIIWRLNLSMHKKLGLCSVFLTGLIGLAASVVSLYYRIYMEFSKGDSTWSAAVVYITVPVEAFITVIVSCVPGCVSAWKRIVRKSKIVENIRLAINSSYATISHKTTVRQSSESIANLYNNHEMGNVSHSTEVTSGKAGPEIPPNAITKSVAVQQEITFEPHRVRK